MHSIDLAPLVNARRPWHSLPQPFYTDPAIFEVEQDAIFARSWVMAGFEVQLATPGSYIAFNVGRSPVLVLRDKQGDIRGFHNSCRHRGAQICPTGAGRTPRLVCPYHQWTYDLGGDLLRATRMGPDFDRAEHGLRAVNTQVVAGCIYVCLSDEAPDFAPFREALEPALTPYNLRDAKVAHVARLEEDANWKLVMENGRECHHCAACHPELKLAFPVSMADGASFHDDAAQHALLSTLRQAGLETTAAEGSWWQIGRYPFLDGVKSYSADGGFLCDKLLCNINGGDVGSLRWAIEPNNFCHAAGDNAIMVNVEPVSVHRTVVTATWLVHKDAVEDVDYSVDRLIHVWDQTNRQDRDLAENNQRGVQGLGYVPGPYSPEAETYVNGFVDWYCAEMAEFARGDRSDHAPIHAAAA